MQSGMLAQMLFGGAVRGARAGALLLTGVLARAFFFLGGAGEGRWLVLQD